MAEKYSVNDEDTGTHAHQAASEANGNSDHAKSFRRGSTTHDESTKMPFDGMTKAPESGSEKVWMHNVAAVHPTGVPQMDAWQKGRRCFGITLIVTYLVFRIVVCTWQARGPTTSVS